jgi:octaprenyl-diphosphate synthase
VGVAAPVEDTQKPIGKLASLMALVQSDMAEVNRIILDKARSDVDLIPELARYLIDSGGKRMRPMLTIAAARLCGYEGTGHIKLAASVEFMHTATLLHDDVVDESDLRRGKKSARLLWGNEASVLVGDFLLGQAFKMMVEVGSMGALAVLSNAAVIIAEGEVLQLSIANNTGSTEEDYLNVINAKTAELFAAAAEVGGIIASRSAEEQAALRAYGCNLGLAFQLIDDALDYSGEQAKLGKSVGDDFREGKITLPVVLSIKRGSEEERKFWRRTLQDSDVHEADLDQAISYVFKSGAIDDTVERARHYGTLACEALDVFPDSAEKTALLDAVEFCVGRGY